MAPYTVKYTLPGSRPPVYIAGSFSDPVWQLHEMEYIEKDGEYEFYKDIEAVEDREYQYKFRIGTGDWWALDEKSPTTTDESGNRNNVLVVPKQPQPQYLPLTHKMDGASSPSPEVETNLPIRDTSSKFKENLDPSRPESPNPPLVVLERVDSKLTHGDDFGEEATDGQKEAHRLRAKDAEPDYVILRGESTPEIAEIAAEVAESAAALDRETATPSIPDEEAGRIGLRRLSNTPIPEVANTAAEVADVAAQLDKEEADNHITPKLNKEKFKIKIPEPPADFDDSSSGTSTPWEDRVPQFSHECVSLPDDTTHIPPKKYKKVKSTNTPFKEQIPFRQELYDPNDPNIEEFPSDRVSILAKLRETQRYMAEDETNVDTVSPSPIIGSNSTVEFSNISFPSPSIVTNNEEISPSLDSIPEGDDDDDDDIPTSTSKSMIIGHGEHSQERKSSVDMHKSMPAIQEADEQVISSHKELPPTVTDDCTESSSHPEITPNAGSNTVGPSNVSSSSVEKIGEQAETAKTVTNAEKNGSTQLKFRKPAEETSTSADTGSSTATVTGITPRKQVSPVLEQVSTPTSIRSIPKEAKSKKFLTNFFTILFVDWICGFFVKVFGGRRNALLAITALVVTITYFCL